MKKIILLFLFSMFGLLGFSVQAQIRHYICDKWFDSNGVQHAMPKPDQQYFAFINSNAIIYKCDKNGSAKAGIGGTEEWHYKGKKDGVYIYEKPAISFGFGPSYTPSTNRYLLLSNDFDRINLVSEGMGSDTMVYERKDPSEIISAPTTMY